MSRRQQLFALVYGLATGWGIFILFFATNTLSRVGGIVVTLAGLWCGVTTIVESRRRRRRNAAPVIRDPQSPAE